MFKKSDREYPKASQVVFLGAQMANQYAPERSIYFLRCCSEHASLATLPAGFGGTAKALSPLILGDASTNESLDEGELGELRSNADVLEDSLGDGAVVDLVSVTLVEAVKELGGLHLAVAILVACVPEALDGILEGCDGLLSFLREAEGSESLGLCELDGRIELLVEPLEALSGDNLLCELFSGIGDNGDPVLNGDEVSLEGAVDTAEELGGVDVHVGAEGFHDIGRDDTLLATSVKGVDDLSEGDSAVIVDIDTVVEGHAGLHDWVDITTSGGVFLLDLGGHGDGGESGGSEGLHFLVCFCLWRVVFIIITGPRSPPFIVPRLRASVKFLVRIEV